MTQSTNQSFDVEALRRQITGRVVTVDDADYDEARMMFYGGVDPHPAAIAKVGVGATECCELVSTPDRPGMLFDR